MKPAIVEKMEKLLERFDTEPDQKKIIPFPVWPPDKRGCPAAMIRSALFGVIGKGRRKELKDELIASWKGCQIKFTGEALDQNDLDVFLMAIHLQSRAPGQAVNFTASGLLIALGRQKGKSGRDWLMRSLKRLKHTLVEIKINSVTYYGSLLDAIVHDETKGIYRLRLNPELGGLFGDDYIRLDWKNRLSLSGNLEKWLHGYILSNKSPHQISVEKLQLLCGSTSQAKFHFREKLKKALRSLLKTNIISVWNINEKDILSFEK
jgi:hypothetical protein